MNPRELLRAAFDAAVSAARGDRLLQQYAHITGDEWCYANGSQQIRFRLPDRARGGRLIVVGAGKAAAALAQGLESSLAPRIDAGAIIVKYGHGLPLQRIQVFEAGHPVPDAAGATATHAVLERLTALTPHDRVIVLLTGGASALLVAPVKGLSLADKAAVHAALVRSGARIDEMNVVRKHLSAVKGGRLAARIAPARHITLAISDVLGDDPATIASGPTVPDPSRYRDALEILDRYSIAAAIPAAALTHLQRGAAGLEPETPKPESAAADGDKVHILASNRQALLAADARLRAAGLVAEVIAAPLAGSTHEAARVVAARIRARLQESRAAGQPQVLLFGGESTLRVAGQGLGGRCQELALVVARELRDVAGFTLLAAGTDGTDGPTDAAGAFVDGTTLQRAQALGLDAEQTLRNNDSYRYFQGLGDLLVTGPTGTNVMDVIAAHCQ